MSLSLNSPTINALGIFGRLDDVEEKYFKDLQDQYSDFTKSDQNFGVFPHLSLVVEREVPVARVADYLDLLRVLKPCLPLQIEVSDVTIIDAAHVALVFNVKLTRPIRDIASKGMPESVVTTHYTKVVRSVPKQTQIEVIRRVREIKLVTFTDFVLCANSPNESSIMYSANRYKP